MNPVVNI